MAKFQLKTAGRSASYGDYEGDSMSQDGEYVKIWKQVAGDPGRLEQVAAIRLDKGQSVVKTQN